MRRTRTSGIGKDLAKKLDVPNYLFLFEKIGKISGQYSDGTAVVDFPVGSYAYKTMQIMIRSKVEIAGVTFERDGTHYIHRGQLKDYVRNVALEINGSIERDHTMDELVKFNQFMGYDVASGTAWMTFGGPHIFEHDAAEDAYLLGTNNVDQLRLLFDLNDNWVDGQMFIEICGEYTRASRPLSYIQTIKKTRYSLNAAGEHTITDLPVNAHLSRIHILGAGLKDVELVVDDITVFKATNQQLRGLNQLYGRDMDAMGDGFTFDFIRDHDHRKALKSLESASQRKRNADIRIVVTTLEADTELQVVMELSGRYATQ